MWERGKFIKGKLIFYKYLGPLGEWGNVIGANWYYSKIVVPIRKLENVKGDIDSLFQYRVFNVVI